MRNPFRYFNSSPEIIRLTMMLYIWCPLSLRQVDDILCERGIDICHETVRLWWNRFAPMFAAEIRRRWVHHRLYFQTNPEKSFPAFSNLVIADRAKSLASDIYFTRMVST